MKLAVITSGFLPVPATKGGAVENLLMNLINENENNNKLEFNIISIFDQNAFDESKKYINSNFIFIKVNFLIRILDKTLFWIVKNFLKKENSHSYRYIFQRLYFLNKCSILLKQNDYDKVLLENHPSQYLALKWRRNYIKYKDKYYYHCHNEFPDTYGCSEIIKNTKNIICVSEFRRKSIEDYVNNPKVQTSVLKNVIDSKIINKKASKKELDELYVKYNIDKNDKVIIFTGRLVPGKGIKEIILALKKVKSKNYKFLFLGSSLNSLNSKNVFENEIKDLIGDDIANNIIFTGFINYNELYKYYSLADFAVLPSTIDDSAPLSVIECTMCKLPVITTNSGGIPEYVDKKTSIVLEKNSFLVNNIAKWISLFLSDEKVLKSFTYTSKKPKDFSLSTFYNNFLTNIK